MSFYADYWIDTEKEAAEQRWLDWLEEISWPPEEAEEVLPGGEGDSDDPPEWWPA